MKYNKLKLCHFVLVLSSSFLLTLSMPGYNLSVLAFVALAPFIYVIIKSEINPYFAGLIFSLIFYVTNLRWLITTISHFGNAPLYISVLILILFAFYLSIYWVVFVYFVTRFKGIFIISTLYIILEIIKGRLFTGFPWLNLGQSQFNNTYILSLASLVGEYGLSFIIIFINLILAKFFLTKQFKFLIFFLTSILVIYFAGFEIYNKRVIEDSNTTIAIAQPAYEQQIKWSQEYTDEIINQVKYLIDKAMKGRSSIIVLPEALFPVLINNDLELLNYMTNLSYKKPLIFGNIRADNINGKYKFYNSAFYINNGKIEFYDKIHLVPFGEYFPLQNIFKPVKYYFFGDSDAFSRGSIIKNFTYKDISISPLICYEGAFVDLVQEAVKKNNDVFVILTNDSWFGNSIGRYQHLAISVIRAVETGKFVIRAAQSGISACIGPDGKIDNFLDIDKSDIIECNLRIQKRTTVFNTVQYLWIFLSLIIIVFNYSVKRFYKLHKQPHKT